MIKYFKFRDDVFAPRPGREIPVKPGPGRGWPVECPPVRAANAFGFDLLANFDLELRYDGDRWSVADPVVVTSDFEITSEKDGTTKPLSLDYAWFWKQGQKLPHLITDNVYESVKHQVKVSTLLFLRSDPDEVLLVTEPPNVRRPFRAVSALIETDWYAASGPWHCVLELDPAAERIVIPRGEPLCRVIPMRRADYVAAPMDADELTGFFERAQEWLEKHGRVVAGEELLDITRTYVHQQRKSSFRVVEE